MPEQMKEALEGAMSRRQAMEKAFDELSGESTEDGTGGGSGEGSGRTGSDSRGSEQVVKVDGAEKGAVVDEKSPIIDDTKKPLKSFGKNSSGVGQAGKGDQKVAKTAEGAKADSQQSATSKYKAPNTWKPDAREHFSTLPERVQEEIARREGEITKVLNDTAASRRLAGELTNIVRPFEGLIRSSGVTPLQAIGNLMNTAATLQTGTMAQKVNIVKDMIRIYGVDLKSLDAALAGQQPTGKSESDELGRLLDQRLKPVNDFMRTIQDSRSNSESRLASESKQTAEQFASDPKNEFFNDLREDIADILDLAANRGREMTLEQAYAIACKQHPEISKVIAQREATAKVTKDAENLQRSRRAASSQPAGSPGGVGVVQGKPGSRREAISQAWDDLSGR